MFGRRATSHPDVVAAARRRLEVMAAELEAAEGRSAGSDSELAAHARAGGLRGPGSLDQQDRDWKSIGAASSERSPDLSPDVPAPPELSSRGQSSGGQHVDRGALVSRERGRWAVTPQQVAIIALAVVAAVAVAAFWVLRSAPDSQPVPLTTDRVLPASTAPSQPSVSTSSPDASAPSAAEPPGSTSAPSVVVDVAGDVRRPGIVELPGGSRVVDALREAGGVPPRTDTSSLNLARVLVDGEQIVVGLDVPAVETAPVPSTSTGEAIAPVNLNTATGVELETLPGIGPVTAAAILQWRTEMGAFSSVDELLEVSGIGDATLAELEPYVYV